MIEEIDNRGSKSVSVRDDGILLHLHIMIITE